MRCGKPGEIDRDRRRLAFLAFAAVVAIVVFVVVFVAMNRRRFGDERVGDVGPQRDHEGPHRLRKAQVELQRVIDRVEVAGRNEVQVFPLRIPGRSAVGPQRRRRIVHLVVASESTIRMIEVSCAGDQA